MADIPDGLYDNRATMAREVWYQGEVIGTVPADTIEQQRAAKTRIYLSAWGTYPDLPQRSQDDPALAFARDMTVSLWSRHYRDQSPDWEPLGDMLGLLTQISNMISGLPQRSTWQPIATAPRDGTVIMVYGQWCGEVGPLHEEDIGFARYTNGHSDRSGFTWDGQHSAGYMVWWNPTHWQPKPEVPRG